VCTIASVIQNGKCYMLKNFDYRPVPTGWTRFEPFDDDLAHFALVDHAQQGLNSGMNSAGLGLQISRSKCNDPSPERLECRTILNAEILSRFSRVPEAVSYIEEFASMHPEMFGGNMMLADRNRISVTEYFGGNARSELLEDGYLVRANHSVFGLIDNEGENSLTRLEAMTTFAEDIYNELPRLSEGEILDKCKERLRTGPILQDATRSSFILDIGKKTIHYMLGRGPWSSFTFSLQKAVA